MILTVMWLAPLVVGLLLVPVARREVLLGAWTALTLLEVVLAVLAWRGMGGAGYAHELAVPWIPAFGVGYHVGVDGLSAPLVAMTTVVFLAVALYSLRRDPAGDSDDDPRRLRGYVLLFLGLEAVSLGLFVALDLVLFFVFFDVSIVLMYFVIAGWGTGPRDTQRSGAGPSDAARSALQFFLYTFVGSLVMLLGFLSLAVAGPRITFDIPTLAATDPLAGRGVAGLLTLAAIGVGLAIKTPVWPVHTWLPPAHTDAPAAGSAVLAAVLLKMGTYGFVRIALPLLPGPWRTAALVAVVLGVVSVLWGALVALAQRDLKRMIAYTSVNHMGYVLLALGAAGFVGAGTGARTLAVTGATVQMVSHGLVTGALFLLAGVLRDRGGTSEIRAWTGVAGPMPRWSWTFAVAALASLGLPGLSGFVAEFSMLAGSLPAVPVATVLAAIGLAVTAALFLRALQTMLLGDRHLPRAADRPRPGRGGVFRAPVSPDLRVAETAAIGLLLAGSLAIGIAPALITTTIAPAATTVVELVSR